MQVELKLKSKGYNLEQISKIHAPIGLNISSKTPQKLLFQLWLKSHKLEEVLINNKIIKVVLAAGLSQRFGLETKS